MRTLLWIIIIPFLIGSQIFSPLDIISNENPPIKKFPDPYNSWYGYAVYLINGIILVGDDKSTKTIRQLDFIAYLPPNYTSQTLALTITSGYINFVDF
jgi:hypothetical protein